MTSNEARMYAVESGISQQTTATYAEIEIFRDYSKKELEDLIEQTNAEYFRLDTENEMFLSYISNENSAMASRIFLRLDKLAQNMDRYSESQESNFGSTSWLGSTSVTESLYRTKSNKSVSTFRLGSQRSVFTVTTDTSVMVQKVVEQLSPLIKIEIAETLIKDKRDNIQKVIKEGEILLLSLLYKIKNAQSSIEEVKQKINDFKTQVVVDPISNRIPAETYLKFVRAAVKKDSSLTDKLRLRSASLRQTCKTTKLNLASKKQLGGILRPVDFELLKIDKTQLSNTLKEKDSHFYGLKLVNGQISLACAEQRRALDDKLLTLEKLRKTGAAIELSIVKMLAEEEVVKVKMKEVRKEIEKLEYKLDHYKTPSLDDYFAKKEELFNLEKLNKSLILKHKTLSSSKQKSSKKTKKNSE